jgi:DNA damage-inducible protein 1
MTVDTLRTTIQAETRIETSSQHLYHNGQLITDHSKTLQELGIADNDMLALHVRSIRGNITGGSGPGGQPTGAARGGAQPPAPDVESLRLQLLGDERSRNVVAQRQPELAAAINDPQRFAQLLNSSRDADQREREERQREIQRLNADPFDVEAQARIAELIRQERVMENLQNAVEYNPEGTLGSLPCSPRVSSQLRARQHANMRAAFSVWPSPSTFH